MLPASAGWGWCSCEVGTDQLLRQGTPSDTRLRALSSGGLWRTRDLSIESMFRGNPRQGRRQRLKVRDKDSVLGREAALSKFCLLRRQNLCLQTDTITKASGMGAVGTWSLRSHVLLGHREEPPNRLEYPGPLGNKQRETPLKPAWESKKIDFLFLRGEMVFVLIICS